ncbi:hypothetical protein [Spirochaeta cellobiosiphila]|uniref:hypothetical protein n=1 Tax=Spirochaeta cellobiosiphila TaxID=504483 RepID=UPI00040AAD3F|nr:hypothetical protein [Spirochaeta cellobiosiphila]
MRKVFVGCLFLWACLGAFGQDLNIIRSYFSPSQYYVGDEATLHLEILKKEDVILSPVVDIPKHPWINIRDVLFSEDEDSYRIQIKFVSYNTGSQTLPDITIGGLTLKGLKIYTESLVDNNNSSISEPKGNLLVPGTRTFIIAVVFVIILVPLLFLGLIQRLYLFFKNSFLLYKHKKIYRKLQSQLDLLRRDIAVLEDAPFYDGLLQAIRVYLQDRLQVPLSSATTAELDYYIGDRIGFRYKTFISDLFRYGDMVKFAHHPAPLGDRRNHLEGVDSLVQSLEADE